MGYHARCRPFDVETQAIASPSDHSNLYQVFGRTLVRLAHADSRIVAITAAMCEGTGLDAFFQRHSQRFMTWVSRGAARGDVCRRSRRRRLYFLLLPFIQLFGKEEPNDQIVHDVCLQKLPVVFAIDRGGLVGRRRCHPSGNSRFILSAFHSHMIVMHQG